MAISVGEPIPDVKLMTPTAEGPKPVRSGEVLGSGTVVLFAVPGAFTPTCSDHHLPGFVLRADELLAKGVDTVACVSVNDAFVMGAWGEAQGVDGKVTMLADGNGDFARGDGPRAGRQRLRPRHPLAALRRRGPRRRAGRADGRARPGLEASSADKVLERL